MVYIASIHAMTLLATSYSPEIHEIIGYSLVSIVIMNLVMNIIIIYGAVLLKFRKNLQRKYTLFIWNSKIYDRKHNWHAYCDCKCITCGGQASKTTHIFKKDNKWVNLNPKKKLKLQVIECKPSPQLIRKHAKSSSISS